MSAKLDTGEEEKALLDTFRRFDLNGDGSITFTELSAVFQNLDSVTWTTTKLQRLMREADLNNDHKIDFEEFVIYVSTGTASSWCKAKIIEAGSLKTDMILSLEDADKLLRACKPSDWKALIESKDSMVRLVMRVALVYTGSMSPTWEDAQSTLADPFQFLRTVLDTEKFIDSLSAERIRKSDEMGLIDPRKLGSGSTMWVLAQYLTACLSEARDRLGLTKKEGVHLPGKPGEASAWPVRIQLRDLPVRLRQAAKCGKTPLIVCNGMETEVDQYFRYRGCLRIDAKRLLLETSLIDKGRKTIEEAREDLRQVVVAAMKASVPLYIKMGNTAVQFRDKFCAEGSFPKELFDPSEWNDARIPEKSRAYLKILTESELEATASWQGGPGLLGPDFFVVVSSDFNKEAAIEHLPATLPSLSKMAIIEIDPPAGGSFLWGGDEEARAAQFDIRDP